MARSSNTTAAISSSHTGSASTLNKPQLWVAISSARPTASRGNTKRSTAVLINDRATLDIHRTLRGTINVRRGAKTSQPSMTSRTAANTDDLIIGSCSSKSDTQQSPELSHREWADAQQESGQ